jgi:hypothetical protein
MYDCTCTTPIHSFYRSAVDEPIVYPAHAILCTMKSAREKAILETNLFWEKSEGKKKV